MAVIVTLLRGINVGGNKRIKMADLQAIYKDLGFGDVRTLLQSGNAVFSTPREDLRAIAAEIEKGIIDTAGFEARVLARSREEFEAVIEAHPFSEQQLTRPSFLRLALLDAEPTSPSDLDDVIAKRGEGERAWVRGRDLYLYYPSGMGRSKINLRTIERALDVVGTARNWNTVLKLRALAAKIGGRTVS